MLQEAILKIIYCSVNQLIENEKVATKRKLIFEFEKKLRKLENALNEEVLP